MGVKKKLTALRERGELTNNFYDKKVFSKMKATLGGNVRIMLTGSAPIAGETLDFLKICFCCPLVEGYGMTETSGGSVLAFPHDKKTGHCGGPVANCKVRLRDLPEMGYKHTNTPPTGEVLFFGPSVMKGYFRNPEKTKEAFHDGWLCSGDVGRIHPNGAISVIDRAKNIFKLQ